MQVFFDNFGKFGDFGSAISDLSLELGNFSRIFLRLLFNSKNIFFKSVIKINALFVVSAFKVNYPSFSEYKNLESV